MTQLLRNLSSQTEFATRHNGPRQREQAMMLKTIGAQSLTALISETVPAGIRLESPLSLPEAMSESEMLAALKRIAGKNQIARSFIGQGYYDTFTPSVIQRNVLENPGWYTAYTPYNLRFRKVV